jgi:hypothetical protein
MAPKMIISRRGKANTQKRLLLLRKKDLADP